MGSVKENDQRRHEKAIKNLALSDDASDRDGYC
jgi:hypothetical protein